MATVLVLGGYGTFGARAVERLAREPALDVVVAGRSLDRAQAFALQAQSRARARISAVRLDANQIAADDLAPIRPFLVVNASGPYQWQDYRVARAAIAAGAHYTDLADARAFVTGIGTLDPDARAAGVLVASGASTVPAIAAAVIDAEAAKFAALESAKIVIAPGNSFDPGLATTESILSTLGRPFTPSASGAVIPRYGWQSLRRCNLPQLGPRWLGACETPDLDLLPQRYPTLRRVEVFAALEVGAFHLGLWALSWLVRGGVVRRPERLASPLLRAKHALRFLGSDVGGMAVTLEGSGLDDARRRAEWHLVARSGHGPYIPALPSVILAKALLSGRLAARGAMPCMGLLTLRDFLSEIADLDITTSDR
jgi:hypothetical protein